MITISLDDNLISASIAGQFTLADYREFEETALYSMRFRGKPDLLMDFRDMLDFTLDVAWEEIKFTREHPNDFNRIAVVTTDQWLGWTAWLSRLYMHTDIAVFNEMDAATAWLQANS